METVTKRRSEALSIDEKLSLKTYREKYDTSVACATSIGIDRNVLERVMLTGSGSPETIAKIKAALAAGD